MNCKISNSELAFSVVIPLYNKQESVASTIESVLNQSYKNFELIIVNDGSTDNSLEVAKSFTDSRIQIIDKKNGGVSSARNAGIRAAKNEYIIPFDADDLWEKRCLDEFVFLIQNFPKAAVFCTSYTIDPKKITLSKKRYYVHNYYLTSAVSMAKWNMPIMVTGCVCIAQQCFDKIGMYNEKLKHGEDYDLWMRLKDGFLIAKSDTVTLHYRLDAENRATEAVWNNEDVFLLQESKSETGSKKLFDGCLNLVYLFSRNKNPYLKTRTNWFWLVMAACIYIWYRAIHKPIKIFMLKKQI